jgi:predicted ester cyclase
MKPTNQQQTEKLLQLMDAGEVDRFSEVCAEDFQISNPFLPSPGNLDVFKGLVASQKAGFPSMKHAVEGGFVCNNHSVAFRGRFSGRHSGTFNGMPASENEVDLPFICIDEYNDGGKLVFQRVQFDPRVIIDQLGRARKEHWISSRRFTRPLLKETFRSFSLLLLQIVSGL